VAASGVLRIGVLGELVIERDDRALALPPSRKTRALLAYLVLTGRAHRREQLCDLFWDVTDDPRGALRWSLSKLRALVDDAAATRIEADREEVGFRASGARIDVVEVRGALAGRAIEAVATAELERLAACYRGELLEGLDLPDFDAYQAWCVAQREEARAIRARLLDVLVDRLRDEPARAVDHARQRVQLDPHDPVARAALIRVLAALGHRDEARAHVTSAVRLAHEAGSPAAAEIAAAAQALDATPRARTARTGEPQPARTTELPPTAATDAGDARRDVPLVGRIADLAALDRFAAGAADARGFHAMLVLADPGVGKSRLLAAWTARGATAGARVITTRSIEADAGHPYAPWIDVLRALPIRADGVAGELTRIARGGAEELGAPLDRQRLFDGIAVELVRAAPVIVVLDDAHWFDAGSAALLQHVARTCVDHAVGVVLAARGGELADNAPLVRALRGLRQLGVLAEHELGPLGAADTAALVRAIRDDADAARVYAQSAGNPLFALELARAASPADALPATVTAAIRDRLAVLPDDAGQVMRWAAVVGRPITVAELEAVSGLAGEVIVEAAELLARRALLVPEPDDALGFAHELVGRVVYAGLSEPRRRLMHRRIAQWLADRSNAGDAQDIAVVAHHAALAHDAALAVETCLQAARRSLRVFAIADAHALARRGLRHVDALAEPDRTRRALELFEVGFAARRPDDVEQAAHQVEALSARALDLGCVEHARLGYHMLSFLRWEHGAWSDARRFMRQAQLVSRAGSEPEQIIGLAEAARCLVLLEKDLGEAHALALEAAARGRIAGVDSPATHTALGMLHLHQGELGEARAQLALAHELAEVRRDHYDEYMALEQLAIVELEAGDLVEARRRAAQLVALGAKFRDGSEAPFATGLLALVRCAAGDAADAELDAACAVLATVDAKQRLAYLCSRAAWLDVERAAPARAIDRARCALAGAEALERATDIVLARAVLARAALAAGDAAAAAAHVDEIVARWDRTAALVRARLAALVADRVPPSSQEVS